MIYLILIIIVLFVFTKALCSLSREDDDELTNDEVAQKVKNESGNNRYN